MKIKNIQLFALALWLIGTLCVPYFSWAENQIGVEDNEINIDISPSNPGPYEDVTISLSSYATDLNRAYISWQTKDSPTASEIGKTSFTVKTGAIDVPIVVNISIKPVNGVDTITKQIIITPSEIEIMWESADGYTPPFYRGKSLPISGSLIKVVAIPNTHTIKSGKGNITYTWKNNDSVLSDLSGYNKNYYIFKNSLFDQTNNVSVSASSISGDYNAEKTIEIPVYKPKMVFYKKSPTEGILYNNALEKETFMSEDEMTLVAEPYFLSMKGNENKFIYTWQVNGKNIDTPAKKTELTIRPTSRGGYATINFVIDNLDELFQKVSNQLKLEL